jgi:MoCo/4Fe-4S cofactor protein with predicted Tat translocation signal
MTNKSQHEPLDLSPLRERLADTKGKQFWRSLEEVAETPLFLEFLRREFPRHAAEWRDPVSRRTFLKLMGASFALAGLTACQPTNPFDQPQDKLVPYVRAPEGVVPGKPLFFASAMPWRGFAHGILGESHEGRPTKIEGNLDQPNSLGATNIYMQASVLTMYDPDRSGSPLKGGSAADWATFVGELQAAGAGAGLRILSEAVTSPTLIAQVEAVLAANSGARWIQYEPINRSNVYAGAQLAFGQPVETRYILSDRQNGIEDGATRAQAIVSLDADFLFEMPGSLRYAREYSDAKRVNEDKREMVRLYVFESTPTITGGMADHHVPVRSAQVEGIARAMAQRLGVDVPQAGELAPELTAVVDAAVADLQANQGAAVVIVGEHQPPIVHALGHAINDAIGAVGQTVEYTEPLEGVTEDQFAGLRQLVEEMNSGAVQTLLILEGNPAFTAPADLGFADALANVPFSAHLSLYNDETSERTTWHINAAHYLESWSDARAFDGTVSIIQPLIVPLFNGKTSHEVLNVLQGEPERSAYDTVLANWQNEIGSDAFADSWQAALERGVLPDTALAPVQVSVDAGALGGAAPTSAGEGFEVNFRYDYGLWDGRFANNGWLQELPRPYTKVTWDNPALISPATAQRLNVRNGDLVTVDVAGRSLQLPVWITPSHADEALTLTLGYGRERVGRVGSNTGFNTYVLRGSDAPRFATGASVAVAGGTYQLVSTQLHHTLDGREIVKLGTIAEFAENPSFLKESGHGGGSHGGTTGSTVDSSGGDSDANATVGEAGGEKAGEEGGDKTRYDLRPDGAWEYTGNKWAMAIDTNVCIGCNACVVACQSENNSPIVGKNEVARGREMQWLRIDEYYEGPIENPRVVYQPMMCVQCEQAPCEVVCPVAATVHDAEGINNMVYNRCVGTKYCSNNCPYKVRRYNFLQYSDIDTPVIKLMRNPDVTVRNLGVMEKCNYCIQRVAWGRQEAERQNRPIADGEVVTACQGACPTKAIVFGNLNDPNAEVVRYKAHPLNFDVLDKELNTKPRTSWLAKLTNTNPDIVTE